MSKISSKISKMFITLNLFSLSHSLSTKYFIHSYLQ